MYSKYLSEYVIDWNDDVYKACWRLHKNQVPLMVMHNEKFAGIVSFTEIQKSYNNGNLTQAGEICNENCKKVVQSKDYMINVRSIFGEYPKMQYIPIIDLESNLVDVVSRQKAFYQLHYKQGRLPRMNYAYCVMNAALEAVRLGYKRISCIEFGVAGGAGLKNLEFHAEAISEILGVDIDVYGFDSGKGLPQKNEGYKDMIHFWPANSYGMDEVLLKSNLKKAKLVIGDIATELERFLDSSVAPIGCMLVDVDYYSSTLPILKFLNNNDRFFMPRIYMYFDDIFPEYEFQGESLAIKEFNQMSEDIKIAPENIIYLDYRMRTKICSRFKHPRYNDWSCVYDSHMYSLCDTELPFRNQL